MLGTHLILSRLRSSELTVAPGGEGGKGVPSSQPLGWQSRLRSEVRFSLGPSQIKHMDTCTAFPVRRRPPSSFLSSSSSNRQSTYVTMYIPDACLLLVLLGPISAARPQLPTGAGGGASCAKPGSLVDIAVESLALHSLNHVPGQWPGTDGQASGTGTQGERARTNRVEREPARASASSLVRGLGSRGGRLRSSRR